MGEQLGNQELINPLVRVREKIVNHLLESGHALAGGELDLLITAITVGDLSKHSLAERYGRVPLALKRGREVTLDSAFDKLDPSQQAHVLLHEYSHGLDSYFQSQNSEMYMQIQQMISELPSNQVSYYSNFLTKKYEGDEKKLNLLQRERTAEVLAQYLESDRSFSGFVQAKLLEFPQGDQDLSEAERTQFTQLREQVGQLGEYLQIADSEEEYEEFLAHHSDLQPHYKLWKELESLYSNADLSQLKTEPADAGEDDLDYDEIEEFWEALELAESIHAEPATAGSPHKTIFQPTRTQEDQVAPPVPFSDLVNFWRIFPN